MRKERLRYISIYSSYYARSYVYIPETWIWDQEYDYEDRSQFIWLDESEYDIPFESDILKSKDTIDIFYLRYDRAEEILKVSENEWNKAILEKYDALCIIQPYTPIILHSNDYVGMYVGDPMYYDPRSLSNAHPEVDISYMRISYLDRISDRNAYLVECPLHIYFICDGCNRYATLGIKKDDRLIIDIYTYGVYHLPIYEIDWLDIIILAMRLPSLSPIFKRSNYTDIKIETIGRIGIIPKFSTISSIRNIPISRNG